MLSSPSWLVPGTADSDISPHYMAGLTQFVEAMIAAVPARTWHSWTSPRDGFHAVGTEKGQPTIYAFLALGPKDERAAVNPPWDGDAATLYRLGVFDRYIGGDDVREMLIQSTISRMAIGAAMAHTALATNRAHPSLPPQFPPYTRALVYGTADHAEGA